MATAKSKDDTRMGETMILGGLGIQIVFFGSFIIATAVFHRRIAKRPTHAALSLTTPWMQLIWVLYVTSALILIRSVFRIAEYTMGSGGELLQKEVHLYVFDGVPMLATVLAFNWFHPSRVITGRKGAGDAGVGSVTTLEVLEGDAGPYEPLRRDEEIGGGRGKPQGRYNQGYGRGQ